HLGARQRPPAPGRQRAVRERADPRANEPPYRMADRLAHPPHLVVATLVDDEFERGRVLAGLLQPDARGRGRPVVELDALAQRPPRGTARDALDLGEIRLVDPARR